MSLLNQLRSVCRKLFRWAAAFCLLASLSSLAGDLDTIGLTQLLAQHPGLTGAGVRIAQPESDNGTPAFEINPATAGQPQLLFTWIATNGIATEFPNSLGTESGHADAVAQDFFGLGTGVAPAPSHVENWDADFFIATVISSNEPITDAVVNQSFIDSSLADLVELDSAYDDYVDTYGTIFCSGAGNGGPVYSPAAAYNGIGVGCYGVAASSSEGPTTDNGRSKPDIVAPSLVTSFSTPYVSGSATLLVQAANEGNGGTNTGAAADVRTIKALLLNGAIKPFGWSHTDTAPLDPRYGSGVLNVASSYAQLASGQHPFSASDTNSAAEDIAPIAALQGWDFETVTNDSAPVVNHYCLAPAASGPFTLTATLVWNRQFGASNANDLTLTLYEAANGPMIAQSASPVDNVQHLYVPNLSFGNYDLQVARLAGQPGADAYALAYQFYPISTPLLSMQDNAGALTLSWPATPTVFQLQQTTNLAPPVSWSNATNAQWLTNGLVVVNLTPSSGPGFYRLIQPR